MYDLYHFDNLHRTLLRALTTAYTLGIIHVGQIAVHGNRFVLALLCTDTAAQAACGAGLLHSRSTVAACAAHRYLLVRRYQLDQSLRTGLGAFSTAGTFRLVYDGYAVLHAERAEHTGLHTGTKAQTAIITFPD